MYQTIRSLWRLRLTLCFFLFLCGCGVPFVACSVTSPSLPASLPFTTIALLHSPSSASRLYDTYEQSTDRVRLSSKVEYMAATDGNIQTKKESINVMEQIRWLLGEIDTVWGGLSSIAAVAIFFWTKTRKTKRYFPQNDTDFYRYYARQISKAKKEVWITSDGFNMQSPKSQGYANLMKDGFERALSKGIVVHRFQILQTMHLNWIDELIKFKQSYDKNFLIYCNRSLQVPNICVIDPTERTCVTENMQHSQGDATQGTLPETYAFEHRSKSSADRMMRIMRQILEHPLTMELDEDNLRRVSQELLQERLAALRAWKSSHTSDDIRQSGVFDEFVIAKFISGNTKEGKS